MNRQTAFSSDRTILLVLFGLSAILIGIIAMLFNLTWLLPFAAVGLGLIILVHPTWGLLLFATLLPLESSFLLLSSAGATITRLLGIFVFGAWFLRTSFSQLKIKIPQELKLGIAFVAWGSLSFFWAYSKNATAARMLTAVQLLMLMMLVVNMIDSKKRLNVLLTALLVGCVIVTVMGLAGVGVASYGQLLTLDDQGAKEYGSYVGLVFLLGSLFFVFDKGRNRFLGFLLSMLTLVPLIRINQRGIFLAIGIAWVVIAIVTKQKFKFFLLIILFTLLLSYLVDILLALGFINEYLANRLTIQNVVETEGTGRAEIWTVGFKIFTQNILSGVGWANFPVVYERYIPIGMSFRLVNRDPHGDLMGVAGELGLVGLLIFIGFYLKIVLKNVRLIWKDKFIKKDVLFILVFGLSIYVFGVGITSTFLWRKVYWLVLGMAIVLYNVYKPEEENRDS